MSALGRERTSFEEPYVSSYTVSRNRFRLTLDTPRATIAACRRPRPPFFVDRRTLHDSSCNRRLCVRRHPLRVRRRAHRDAQLPLQGLPAVQWRTLRFWHRGRRLRNAHQRDAEDVLGPGGERRPHHPQLLCRLRDTPIHSWRRRAGLHVDPLPDTGRSVRFPANGRHLDVERAAVGLPRSADSAVQPIAVGTPPRRATGDPPSLCLTEAGLLGSSKVRYRPEADSSPSRLSHETPLQALLRSCRATPRRVDESGWPGSRSGCEPRATDLAVKQTPRG